MKFSAVLLMGGTGDRFGSPIPKQLLPLGEILVYEHALFTLVHSGLFDEIIIVSEPTLLEQGVNVPEELMQEGGSILLDSQIKLIAGGATRQESSYNGILACSEDTDYVVIHDGARPFVSEEIIERNVECVMRYGAINTCIHSPDAINVVQNTKSKEVMGRDTCMLGQTPQSFSLGLIREAHEKTKQKNAIDDCSLVQELGHPVHIVIGEQINLKITTPQDLAFAKSLL